MKKILALCGSNSSTSINNKLLDFTVAQISNFDVSTIDLKEYDFPIYSMDIEKESGIPEEVKELSETLSAFKNIIIATNEHNWTVSVFFKNIIDWLSRADSKFIEDKKLFIISTSPGRGGANLANQYLVNMLPKFNAKVTSHFSLKSFNHSFSEEKGIYDEEQRILFENALDVYLKSIS